MINLDDIKIGDKFSTVNKLLNLLGYNKTTNKLQIERNITDCKRYLAYEKTGKISRGKVTNEIVITDIYSTPLDKVDLRVNNGGSRNVYNFNFTELFDTMAYIMADDRTNSVTETHSYTMKDLYTRYGLLGDNRNILDNQDNPTEYDKEVMKNVITHNYYVADIRNKFKGLVISSMDRLNKKGDIMVTKDYFVYGLVYSQRKLATYDELEIISNTQLEAFKQILNTDDNRKILTEKCYKKFEKDTTYKLGIQDLFLDYKIQNEYWRLRNELFNNVTGKNYCSCYTFELNEQRDDLVDNKDFHIAEFEVKENIKDSLRKWSVILIMTKGQRILKRTFARPSVIDYKYRKDELIRAKHESIFGKENWSKYTKIKIRKDIKDNLGVFDMDIDDEDILCDDTSDEDYIFNNSVDNDTFDEDNPFN